MAMHVSIYCLWTSSEVSPPKQPCNGCLEERLQTPGLARYPEREVNEHAAGAGIGSAHLIVAAH